MQCDLIFSVKDMYILVFNLVESGSRLIGLFEFGFFASELQLQQHAAGNYSISALLSDCLRRVSYCIWYSMLLDSLVRVLFCPMWYVIIFTFRCIMLLIQVFGPSSGPSLAVKFYGSSLCFEKVFFAWHQCIFVFPYFHIINATLLHRLRFAHCFYFYVETFSCGQEVFTP